MIKLGQYHNLRAIKRMDQGFYLLGDEQTGNILLPNKHVPDDLEVDDEIEVFIYNDSDDRIIATTLRPFALVGEFAVLEVSSVESFGVFLNWGLEKDLFVPFKEQLFEMVPGKSYVVYIYIDNSNRIAASTRLKRFIDKSEPPYELGEQVDLILYQKTDMGMKAIINGQYGGLIYKDERLEQLKIGAKIPGYIKSIREDHKIDLTIYPHNNEYRKELADVIIDKLKKSDGFININSKSSAEEIHTMFNVSRKKFKIALGYLYKQQLITTDDSGTTLIKK